MGHRKDILTTSVDNVLTKLSVKEVSQRVKEMQALQLFSEALTSKRRHFISDSYCVVWFVERL